MNFGLIPLTFDVWDTNTYGWVTHTRMCQIFCESSQNAMKLLPLELPTLGNMPLKYQLKMTMFGYPYMAVTHLCMGDVCVCVTFDTIAYWWVWQLQINNQEYTLFQKD